MTNQKRLLSYRIAILGLLLVAGFGIVPGVILAQTPTGTAFTYQGRLARGGTYPVSLTCDFTFGLFDAPSGGNRLGSDQTKTGVTVQDGYFQVELNGAGEFGASAFNGQRRYLQVAVRCPGDPGFTVLGGRVELKSVPYAQRVFSATLSGGVAWSTLVGLPAGFSDGLDNEAVYSAGYGLVLTGTQFSLITSTIINAISPSVQLRVKDSCPANASIQLINPDGSVVCATTTITYTAGSGLKLTNGVFTIDDAVTQRQIAGSCGLAGSQQAIRQVYQDGKVLCEPIPQGDITTVNAGSGLSGGGGGPIVTMTVATGGIDSNLLADNAVTTSKLADASVQTAQLVGGAVTSDKIEDRSVQFNDLGMICASGQMMKWDATGGGGSGAWECGNNLSNLLLAGPGISIVNETNISARTGEGITVDGSNYLAVDFGGNGVSNQPARSNHHHDLWYVKPSTTLAAGDVSGSYDNGLTVTGLQGRSIQAIAPQVGQTLRFFGVSWQPSDYNFPLEPQITIRSKSGPSSQGIITVTCLQTEKLVGGGCNCQPGKKIRDTFPLGSDSWYCNCQTGNDDSTAYAICIKPTYP